MSNDNFQNFTALATVILGIMIGFLFTIPIAFSSNSATTALLVPVGAAMGGLVGYKRRKSKAFFYLALFTAATLTTIVYIKMIPS